MEPQKAPTRPQDCSQMVNMRPQGGPRNPPSDILQAYVFLVPHGGLAEHVPNHEWRTSFISFFKLPFKRLPWHSQFHTFKLLILFVFYRHMWRGPVRWGQPRSANFLIWHWFECVFWDCLWGGVTPAGQFPPPRVHRGEIKGVVLPSSLNKKNILSFMLGV